MQCTMYSIPISAVQEGGAAPTPLKFTDYIDEHLSTVPVPQGLKPGIEFNTTSIDNPPE